VVDEQMAVGDLVAILRVSSGVGVLQQFTSDKRLLHAAIDRIRFNLRSRGSILAISSTGGMGAAVVDTSPDGGGSRRQFLERMVRTYQVQLALATLGALDSVVQGLQSLPGRKSVIFVSEGSARFGWDQGGGGVRDPFGVDGRVQDLVDRANRSSVVFYSLDPAGLRTVGSTAGGDSGPSQTSLATRLDEMHETLWGLATLADSTGGLLVADTNDLAAATARILDDQKGYYLMGYVPDQANVPLSGGRPVFHKLDVKVKRPSLQVRSRRSFVAVDAQKEELVADETPHATLTKAAVSPFGSSEIRLRLTALFGCQPKKDPKVRSFLHIDGHDLTFVEEPDGTRKAEVEIVALTLGTDGRPLDQVLTKGSFRVAPNTFARAVEGGFVRIVEVTAKKPGLYQFRVAVRDTVSGRTGSASELVEVPNIRKGHLALSGIVLSGPDTDPNASAAVRRFRAGMSVSYACVIYSPPPEKEGGQAAIETRVRVLREGEALPIEASLVFDPRQAADVNGLPAGGSVQLPASLDPGDYTLEIAVADRRARKDRAVAAQWMDFEVVD
jgi:VWFA-related protein